MKLAKRLLSLALVAVMLMASCIIVGAAPSYKQTGSYEFANAIGVTHTSYSVSGSNTESLSVVTISKDSGYVPMVYTATNGGASLSVKQHYEAAIKDGYEVVAGVNGSLFKYNSNSKVWGVMGIDIVEGVVIAAHDAVEADAIVGFDSQGNMKVVDSNLSFGLTHNGTAVSGGVASVNKKYKYIYHLSVNVPSEGARIDNGLNRFHYYDANSNDELASEDWAVDTDGNAVSGWEVVCQVTNGSLSVGGTLTGKVVSANYGKSYRQTKPAANQFVLYAKTGTAAAQAASKMAVNDTITINVNETSADQKTVAGFHSAFGSHGVLVKNGVDMTANGTAADYDWTAPGTKARWTAIATDKNGNISLVTSEGGTTGESGRGLSMKEFAQTLVAMGFKDAVRFDGGGSTALYVADKGSGEAGYVMSTSRNCVDTLLFVKQSTLKNPGDTSVENVEHIAIGKDAVDASGKEPLQSTVSGFKFGAVLTDGKAEKNVGVDGSWFTFMKHHNCTNDIGSVTIDLGAQYQLSGIKLHLANSNYKAENDAVLSAGQPAYVKIMVSADNENFTTYNVTTKSDANIVYWAGIETAETARYIKVEVKVGANSNYALIDEIAVNGYLPEYETIHHAAEGKDAVDASKKDPLGFTSPSAAGFQFGKVLTDGKAQNEVDPIDKSWFTFMDAWNATSDKTGSVTIDLGSVISISEIKLHLANSNKQYGNGTLSAVQPEYVKIMVSTDNVNFTTYNVTTKSDAEIVYWAGIKEDISARYVKVEIKIGASGRYALIDEIAVIEKDTSSSLLRGDVNLDTKIDKKDFAVLKRHCVGTTTLTGDAFLAADVNNDTVVDKKDFAALKRYCIGTYEIPSPVIK